MEFKTVSDFVNHLEASDSTTVDKTEVIEALKTITSRPAGQRRGQLQGLSLEEMTDEQLKREKINANSVLYKAKQRGASEETIAKNQARVDAANAESAKRNPAPATAEVVEGETTEAVEDEI